MASARGQGIPQVSFIQPVMTDLGVSLLLISQHALLIATLLFACVSATEFPIVQMLIAGWLHPEFNSLRVCSQRWFRGVE